MLGGCRVSVHLAHRADRMGSAWASTAHGIVMSLLRHVVVKHRERHRGVAMARSIMVFNRRARLHRLGMADVTR